MSAKEHLSEAEMTSNLESETDTNKSKKKRTRKEMVIVLPGESSSSGREDEDNQGGVKKSYLFKSKINLFPSPPPPSHALNNVYKTPQIARAQLLTSPSPLHPISLTNKDNSMNIPPISSSSGKIFLNFHSIISFSFIYIYIYILTIQELVKFNKGW